MKTKKTPNRNQRVADQIQRDLAELIAREVRDPRVGMVTISGVELSADYAHAKVHFTVIGSDPAEAQAGLNAAAGHLHRLLFRRLRIHTVPQLTFVRDASLEEGFRIDGLIREALAPAPLPLTPAPLPMGERGEKHPSPAPREKGRG
jgi:ribosome-binding factor A